MRLGAPEGQGTDRAPSPGRRGKGGKVACLRALDVTRASAVSRIWRLSSSAEGRAGWEAAAGPADDKDKEDKTPSEIYSTSSKKCLVEKVKAKEVPRINK